MSEDKSDLTRIEDLGEFIHENSTEVDSALSESEKKLEQPQTGLDELESIEGESFQENSNEEGHQQEGHSGIHDDSSSSSLGEESLEDFSTEIDSYNKEDVNTLEGEEFDSTEEFQESNSDFEEEPEIVPETTLESDTNIETTTDTNFFDTNEDENSLLDDDEQSSYLSEDSDNPIDGQADHLFTEENDTDNFSFDEELPEEPINDSIEDPTDNMTDQEFLEPDTLDDIHESTNTENDQGLEADHMLEETSQENPTIEEISEGLEDQPDSKVDDILSTEPVSNEQVKIDETNNNINNNTSSNDTEQIFKELDKKNLINEVKVENIKAANSKFKRTLGLSIRRPSPLRELNKFHSYQLNENLELGGNPPYSLLLKDIRYKDEIKEIIDELKKHNLITDKNENIYKNSLITRSLLIPQLSENLAIILANKFKHLHLKILFGLSEEIFSPRESIEDPYSRGITNKIQILKNSRKNYKISPVDEVLMFTSELPENYELIRQTGLIHVSRKLIMRGDDKGNQEDSLVDFLTDQIKDKARLGKNNAIVDTRIKKELLPDRGVMYLQISIYGIGSIIKEQIT
jgi:hypothetical protein